MDFELPGEDHPQRKAVRAWFEANPEPSSRDLAEAGYVVPHWPKPWGLAAEPELQLIIDEEMKRAGVVAPRNPDAYSPGFAGDWQAISMQRTVSRISRKPRRWPPLPYTVSGCPMTASTQKRLRTVPKTSS